MSLPIQPEILDAWPFTAESEVQLKALTDASSSIALVVGGYQIVLQSSSTEGATGKLGGTAVEPLTGVAAILGFHMAPGVTYTLYVRTAASLHVIMNEAAATGNLRITRVR